MLKKDERLDMVGSISNMVGAYPARFYKGFFSARKSKLDKHPVKNQVSDIVACKMPDFALIDARESGVILAGKPLELDKQAAKVLGMDWRSVGYLRLLDEVMALKAKKESALEGQQRA